MSMNLHQKLHYIDKRLDTIQSLIYCANASDRIELHKEFEMWQKAKAFYLNQS